MVVTWNIDGLAKQKTGTAIAFMAMHRYHLLNIASCQWAHSLDKDAHAEALGIRNWIRTYLVWPYK
jgi:hypothetical protein